MPIRPFQNNSLLVSNPLNCQIIMGCGLRGDCCGDLCGGNFCGDFFGGDFCGDF